MSEYLITISVLIVALVFFEMLSRSQKALSKKLVRKMVHVVSSLIVIVCALVFSHTIFIAIGLVFGLGLILARRWMPLDSLSDRAESSLGEIMFPLGVAVTAAVAQDVEVFVFSVAVLGISDTVAYVVGSTVSSRKLIFEKTFAGSVAFALSSTVLLVWILPIVPALAISVTLAVTELFSPRGSDNLSLPILCALLLNIVV